MLKVQLVEEVPLVESEMLSDAESAEFAKNYPDLGFGIRAGKMFDLSGNGRLLVFRERTPCSSFPSQPSLLQGVLDA